MALLNPFSRRSGLNAVKLLQFGNRRPLELLGQPVPAFVDLRRGHALDYRSKAYPCGAPPARRIGSGERPEVPFFFGVHIAQDTAGFKTFLNWIQVDTNFDLAASGLVAYLLCFVGFKWYARVDSNHRPFAPEAAWLP